MIVDLFIPCNMDQFHPETAKNVVRILEHLDIGVNYPIEQTCCGQISFNAGQWDDALRMGESFIKQFSNGRYVVVPSASCVSMVRKHYTRMFFNTSLHLDLKKLQSNIFELTDFIVNVMKINDIGGRMNTTVTYHDSCKALRSYGIHDEPRVLLESIRGLELIEMKNSDECCGFGGSFSHNYAPISAAMGLQKLQNAMDTGAEYLVSTEASCLMHLKGIAEKNNLPIKTKILADILAESITN